MKYGGYMELKYCSNCGSELRNGAIYCSSCGASVEKKVYKQREIKGVFDYYKDAISKYATFVGRTSLREYWHFVIANLIIGFVGGLALVIVSVLLGVITQTPALGFIVYFLGVGGYGLYIIIPSIAITVRRLHDQDKSGAWYFIVLIPYIGAIILLIFTCLRGTPWINQYGEPVE